MTTKALMFLSGYWAAVALERAIPGGRLPWWVCLAVAALFLFMALSGQPTEESSQVTP